MTNIQIPEILKASHIKPWKDSNNIDRLDPYNGLLLTPNMDSLFNLGFITFENDGQIELSKKVNDHIGALHLYPEMKLRNVFVDNIKYLEYHRDKIFLK
ncbi:HNH endonuclease [Pedobacter sp. UYP1]|uniref:HNH endonuclease n=1 Tax=Pedobacter sp. UYP1 TaxID=1756396 RepID=UPI00339655D8